MLARIGDLLTRVFRHTAPEPFVLAVLLTALAFWACAAFTDTTSGELVAMWSDADSGVWKFLEFGMQMCLILVTGFAVAASKPVSWALHALAGLPRSGAQGALLVAFTAASLGVLHWGLGLIGGAILARDVTRALKKRNVTVHAPLIAAAGYAGMLVWHGGFSGSAPITMTTEKQIAKVFPTGMEVGVLSLRETLLSPLNLVATIGLIVIVPILFMLLTPKSETTNEDTDTDTSERTPAMTEDEFSALTETTNADRPGPFVWLLERTPIANYALAALIGVWAFGFYAPDLAHSLTDGALGKDDAATGALRLGPNTLNLTFLLLAL
ncbi:MAG: TIGR00366 family protein, partial [Planctomycetota bacterium]